MVRMPENLREEGEAMILEQYDRALLKDGDFATVVEIFDGGKAIIADIDRKDGTETDWIELTDIEKIISR